MKPPLRILDIDGVDLDESATSLRVWLELSDHSIALCEFPLEALLAACTVLHRAEPERIWH